MVAFLVAVALAMDPTHANLRKALDRVVVGDRVDYAALKASPQALDAYLAEVASASPEDLRYANEVKAFWINAYNALTLDLVADHYPLASIRDLDGGKPWSTRRFRVAGQDLTLDDIEHKKLRPLGDPRIHAALNCASIGCPPLARRPYTSAGLHAELEGASGRWADTATLKDGVLTINRIFDWYGEDFVPHYGKARFDIPGVDGKEEAAANFIAAFVSSEKAEAIRKGGYRVAYAEYDWGLNGR